jgi:hypothetical protein
MIKMVSNAYRFAVRKDTDAIQQFRRYLDGSLVSGARNRLALLGNEDGVGGSLTTLVTYMASIFLRLFFSMKMDTKLARNAGM